MDTNDTIRELLANIPALPDQPPLVWPDARYHTGQAIYRNQPPFENVFLEANLIAGVLVGAADKTIDWVRGLLRGPGICRIHLVVLVYPTSPTREEHLISLQMLESETRNAERNIHVRLLPANLGAYDDYEKMVLPPTLLQAHNLATGKTTLCIGSVGDAGWDTIRPASFNVVFHPDDSLRDSWRRWFQFVFSMSDVLTAVQCVSRTWFLPGAVRKLRLYGKIT